MRVKRIILILAVVAVVAFALGFILVFQQVADRPAANLGALQVTTREPSQVVPSFVTLYELPKKNSAPIALTVAKSGDIWYASSNGSRIGVFNPQSEVFKEYQVPDLERGNEIWSLVFDSNGELWFPSVADNAIFKFSPSTEQFTKYIIPTNNSFPIDLAVDREGRIWFTELFGGKMGVLDPRSTMFEEFTLPDVQSGPAGLFLDDDSVWFAEAFAGRIGRFDVTTRTFEEFNPPQLILSPVGVTVNVDGTVWFAEHGSNMFGRLDPNGEVTRYPTSAALGFPFSLPYWLEFDQSGSLWFNEHGGNRLAVFDAKSSTLTEYTVAQGNITGILRFSRSQDGRIWFSQTSTNKIGYIDPNKAIKLQVSAEPEQISLATGDVTKIRLRVTGDTESRLSLDIVSNMDDAGVAVNMTATFNPSTIQVDGEAMSTLTLRAAESLKPGKYILGVTVSDGQVIHTKMIPLKVVSKS